MLHGQVSGILCHSTSPTLQRFLKVCALGARTLGAAARALRNVRECKDLGRSCVGFEAHAREQGPWGQLRGP
eukprot:365467-Chlamydomonas_euryale.AAC.22